MLETRSLGVLSYAILLVVATSASLSLGQVNSVCNNASLSQCDLCIRADPECYWCPVLPEGLGTLMDRLETMGYENYRCRGPEFPLPCTESVANLAGAVENRTTEINKVEDRPLSADTTDTVITQVRPQNVSIKLRRGETVKFNMTFISLRNTPLDIYFLTDVSSSLQHTLDVLRNDITVIAERLRDISSGFAMGFGSFVDKKILPFGQDSNLAFVNRSTGVLECALFNRDQCEPSYVYRHSITLTNNVTQFQEILPSVSILSRSLDSPESPLDALTQAALCKDIIGWRDDALKMVFLFTDQSYKFAGDGRIAGLVQPNEGRCNLAKIPGRDEYEYTRGTEEDYVSVWQMRNALEINRIVPVFVIQFDLRCALDANNMPICPDTTLQREPYIDLLRELEDRNIRGQFRFFNSSVGQMSPEVTQQLIGIIEGAYNDTVQQVEVSTPTNSDGYRIFITPLEGCVRESEEEACRVDFDDTVTFEVSITLENCATAKRFSHQLRGGPYDFTYIDVEPLCECECTETRITDDNVCNGRGEQVCGVCECDDTFSGPECQCTARGTCSSRLDCNGYVCDVCGFCDCNGTAFGLNCQCNDTNNPCMEFGGQENLICSGPERGECNCELEMCECKIAPLSGVRYFGTTGTADAPASDNNCECDPDQCYNPQFPDSICYDQVNGSYTPSQCGCSGCVCGSNQFTYRNTCVNSDLLCRVLSTCVQCYLSNPGVDCPNSDNACQNHIFEQISGDQVITGIPEGYQDRCELEFEDCTVEFYFSTMDTDPIMIENLNSYSCPASTLPWIIAGSLVGAILLLGLLALIILKICLVFIERVEYRKFTKELQEADFAPHENPLYITPQQDYQNPIRRSSTRRSQ